MKEHANEYPRFFSYWGKARPANDHGALHHLLVFHCLDVAAVGVAFLRRSPSLLRSCCQLLNCSDEAFLSWTSFLLALHDLGKFSEAFQSQRADLILALQNRAPNGSKQHGERHDTLGFWLWEDYLVDNFLADLGIDNSNKMQRSFRCWLRAVTGHHGMPPKPSAMETVDRYFLKEDKSAAADFVGVMADLLLTDEARRIPTNLNASEFQQASEMLSWWFAGVAVLADWLGSNTQFFAYEDQARELDDYWTYAQRQALEALTTAGVFGVAVESGQSMNDFFPFIKDASPLQHWAATVTIPPAPQIYLLEDVTGAGKTEAAMMLVYRLMAQSLAEGFFIGLPTMATANAMYQRVAEVYRKLFHGNANLVLAHGNKKLVEEFAASILPVDAPEHDSAQLDETASARCSAWLADHSKRSLLATAGVGTIDQALLAVLHSKHQSLRLLGLFNKVLVVDEVHACDAYMQGVLEVLLEFHARTDGSVILLSATLPNHMKQSLLNAYARGRNQARAPQLISQSYPLATRWHDGQSGLLEDPLGSRPNVCRTVQVHYESDPETVYRHIVSALQQGHCVGWIRNTVADAMDAVERLSKDISGDRITLFHARFSLKDRLEKEAEILSRFGKDSAHQQRRGRLVVATQVAEQSLDVDWDVLITDLAPIDRLLQRAGRLQRHVRDAQGNPIDTGQDQRASPCLWVHAPTWTAEPSGTWYSKPFPKAAGVYPNHGQLWLTARQMQQPQFSMPTEARMMIETVFSHDAEVPDGLRLLTQKAEGEGMSEASLAQQNTLKIGGGYVRGNNGDWWSEAKTPSRLGDEVTEVMLAKWVDGELRPWINDVWPYSMVKVATRWLAKADVPSEVSRNAAYCRLQQTLPSEGKWCVLLPLSQASNGVWQAQAWTAGNERRDRKPELLMWRYDAEIGLRLAEADNTEEAE